MTQYLPYLLVFAAVFSAIVVVAQTMRAVGQSGVLSRFGLHWMDEYYAGRRRAAFEARILDLTMGLANAMKAGMALPQAMEKVGAQMEGVMHEEVFLTLQEYRLGKSVSDAVERLAERMPCEDMRLLSSSIKLTIQTGGSLVDVLAQMTETIRKRAEFHGKLQTLTAQGRFEAMAMASAPLVAFGVLYLCQPDLMQPLVTTLVGWIAIAVALVLEIVGFLVIRHIVAIEV